MNRGMTRPTLPALSLVATIGAVGAFLAASQGWRQGGLWLIGAALGGTLWQSSFSFAGAYRLALTERRTAGLRAQLLMIAVAACLFLPALDAGSVFGQPVRGFVFPIGMALLVGAFLFGIGMQLGGGCGSGTLFAAGGGAARSWLTLASFVVGATIAAWDGDRWLAWPALAPVSLPAWLGVWPSMAGSVAVLGAFVLLAGRVERGRHGEIQALSTRPASETGAPTGVRFHLWPLATGLRPWAMGLRPWAMGLRPLAMGLRPLAMGLWPLVMGLWPLATGAIVLAGLNFLTLIVAGRPWAITAASPLWGSKAIDATGFDDPTFWAFWDDPTRTEALLRPLLSDRTTIMDVGLVAGAGLAAILSGRPRPVWPNPRLRPALAAVLGGLLLGYGAVLATGCNISAFVGGIASGSLHGWVWIVPALAGNFVGIRLRPWFRLAP